MKKITYHEFQKVTKELLEAGELVIGKIRVDDGENINHYTDLSECPAEHREGYRRALETVSAIFLHDVVYEPVIMIPKHAQTIATLE